MKALVQWWAGARGEWRIVAMAAVVWVLDQASKAWVVQALPFETQRPVVRGFLSLVHWGNTGSAWSLFHGNNGALALVALAAVAGLWYWRHHFEAHRMAGQVALGMLFGGTLGNLVDRLLPSRRHVVDFLYFHVVKRSGAEAGFPAFNVADMAICTGVGLLLLLASTHDGTEEAKPDARPS
ncbi:MAG: signal peptidase II [Verrucomicrobiota bacterium]|jgi:signal peptidase II